PERARTSKRNIQRCVGLCLGRLQASAELFPVGTRLEITRRQLVLLSVKANFHWSVDPALPQIDGKLARRSLLHGNAVLRDANGAWRSIRHADSLRLLATDLRASVEIKNGPVSRASGMPRLFFEVGFWNVFELVRAEPFKAAVVEFFGPHA